MNEWKAPFRISKARDRILARNAYLSVAVIESPDGGTIIDVYAQPHDSDEVILIHTAVMYHDDFKIDTDFELEE